MQHQYPFGHVIGMVGGDSASFPFASEIPTISFDGKGQQDKTPPVFEVVKLFDERPDEQERFLTFVDQLEQQAKSTNDLKNIEVKIGVSSVTIIVSSTTGPTTKVFHRKKLLNPLDYMS